MYIQYISMYLNYSIEEHSMVDKDKFEIPCCDIDGNDRWYYKVIFQRKQKTIRLSINTVPLFFEDELIEAQSLIVEHTFSTISKGKDFINDSTRAINNKDCFSLHKILLPLFKKKELYQYLLMNKLPSKLSDYLYNCASYYPNLGKDTMRYSFSWECDICCNENVSVKCTYCDCHYCWRCRKRVEREKVCFKCRNQYV